MTERATRLNPKVTTRDVPGQVASQVAAQDIPGQVSAAVAASSTVTSAAAAAVTADIAGRDIVLGTDARMPRVTGSDQWLMNIVDTGNALAVGVDLAGDTWLRLRPDALLPDGTRFGDLQKLILETGGMLWQVTDSAGRVALAVDPSGDVVISGLSTDTRALIRNALSSVPPIYCWGDSLTAAGTWESLLATTLGVSVVVNGINGQKPDQIAARQGGQPALVTLTSDTIPTSGSVAVTAISVNLLAQTPDADRTMLGSIAGVDGTLSHLAADNSYSFTRTASGTAVYVAPGTPFVPATGETARGNHQIIWSGRNNVDTTVELKYIGAMIKHLTAPRARFLVLEIPPMSTETPGSPARTSLDAANAALQDAYPNQFIPVATYLRSNQAATDAGITYTSQDLTDIGNKVTPTSFRVTGDVLHLNATGQTALGKYLSRIITQKGWALL